MFSLLFDNLETISRPIDMCDKSELFIYVGICKQKGYFLSKLSPIKLIKIIICIY